MCRPGLPCRDMPWHVRWTQDGMHLLRGGHATACPYNTADAPVSSRKIRLQSYEILRNLTH